MILHAVRGALAARAQAWFKAQGIPAPADLSLKPAPPHVAADLSLAWPLAAAKAARRPPLEVAKELAAAFAGTAELEEAGVSPPGFVNVKLKNSALCANLKAITLAPAAYGRDEGAAPSGPILIEFVSANPTGPLHMASGRGATIGDCLVRILRRLGRDARSEYYVNDAGRQVELLGLSLQARRRGQAPPEDGYQGEYITELAQSFPPEADGWTAERFREEGIKALLATHERDMAAFGVTFDRWFRESELHGRGALDVALEKLKARGMVYEKDGAVWLGTSGPEELDDKDRVLIRADKRPTYFLADIAYHEDKYARGNARLIDILGTDHHGYVPRMRAAITALGYPPESFHPIVHQLILLFRGKEAVKMSKRAGEFVRLKDLLDEVGKDACRFFFAARTPDSHLHFDLELAKKQSSENPVYYCQYVHARICSIFREAEKQGLLGPDNPLPGPNGRLLTSPEERALLLKLAWFPEALKTCAELLSPHPLANYVLELAGLFHPFYEKHRVVAAEDPETSRARLLLCAGVRDVIKEGLGLLGVSAPEQM